MKFATGERWILCATHAQLNMNVAGDAATVRIMVWEIDRARGADQNLTP